MADEKRQFPALAPPDMQILYHDNGDGTKSPVFYIAGATINAGDLEVGAVELKNASDDTRAKIAILSSLVAGDIGLGVADPVLAAALAAILGTTADAAVGDATGTINAHLRQIAKTLATGEAVSIVDGGDVTQGAKADAAVTNPATSASEVAILKGLLTLLSGGLPAALGQGTMAQSLRVVLPSDSTDLPVTQKAATIPAATTMQNAATASGNGTSLPATGFAGAIINIVSSVAMSGGTTVNFEASVDDTTWVAINAHKIGTQSLATTTTSDGDYRVSTAGYKSIRARISAYSAGTVTIKGYASPVTPGLTTVTAVPAVASTGTASTVASSATNVTLLAANALRLGATVWNESTQVLYLKLGATASATSYAAQLAAGAYYEVPFRYTGIIDGIWASANGNARVTELS